MRNHQTLQEKIKNKTQTIAAVMTMMFASFGTAAHASTCFTSGRRLVGKLSAFSQAATGKISRFLRRHTIRSAPLMAPWASLSEQPAATPILLRSCGSIDTGTIDARNSTVFAAAAKIPYSAGTKYHFHSGCECCCAYLYRIRNEWLRAGDHRFQFCISL